MLPLRGYSSYMNWKSKLEVWPYLLLATSAIGLLYVILLVSLAWCVQFPNVRRLTTCVVATRLSRAHFASLSERPRGGADSSMIVCVSSLLWSSSLRKNSI
jgi:hypothetical protein